MKRHILFLGLIIFFLPALNAQNDFKKIDPGQISQETLNSITQLVDKIMSGQKSGNCYLLTSEEASDEMVKAFTSDVQKQSYETLQQNLGDYSGIRFVEAINYSSYVIYRFKATFSKSDDKPEIRAVLNKEGKLGGLWVRPWKDEMDGNP